jgi:GATA-binding protein
METLYASGHQANNLVRHPSAEDLDAAQQLISSSRGARELSSDFKLDTTGTDRDDGWQAVNNNSPRDEMDVDVKADGPGPNPGSSAASTADPKRSPQPSGKDASFLGHSCRYVVNRSLQVVTR